MIRTDHGNEADREYLILCFARYCWPRRNTLAPSGKQTWGDAFQAMSGMTLYEYRDMKNEDKQREK